MPNLKTIVRLAPGTRKLGNAARGPFARTLKAFAALRSAAAPPPPPPAAALDFPPWGTGRGLFFSQAQWMGEADFVHPITDQSSFGSLRTTPFTIDFAYHIIADGADFPGNEFDAQDLLDFLVQLVELDKRLTEVHQHVRHIWRPYLIDLRKTPVFTIHWTDGTAQYFDMANGELATLASDTQFNWDLNVLHCVIANTTPGIGQAGTGDITNNGRLDHPVFIAEMQASVFGLARTVAHEAGHKFGLDHGANADPSLLMSQTSVAQKANVALEKSVSVSDTDVEKAHTNLASNNKSNPLFRKENA